MQKVIIIVNGSSQNGKDEFVKMLPGYLQGIPVVRISTVDPIYKAMVENLCIDLEPRDDRKRKFMSDLKDLWTAYDNGPFKYVVRHIGITSDALESVHHHKAVFCIMCREPMEIQKLVHHFDGDAMTLLVKGLATHVPNNHADRNVGQYEYDNVIVNDGTLEELEAKAQQYAEKLFAKFSKEGLTSAA